MSQFTEAEGWCRNAYGTVYETTQQLRWEVGRRGSRLWVSVPVGFHFDLSVPKWLRWLVNPHDPRLLKAACLHDYALGPLGWDRVTAAGQFSEALRAQGVGRVKRLAMTLAVIAWNWQ